jgi:hypothetical protein
MNPMANGTRVEIHHEVALDKLPNGRQLCFQSCTYRYGDDKPDGDAESEPGFRFIWRLPDGKLATSRGQARIPSISQLDELLRRAKADGWGE